jgi:hypothetical protein
MVLNLWEFFIDQYGQVKSKTPFDEELKCATILQHGPDPVRKMLQSAPSEARDSYLQMQAYIGDQRLSSAINSAPL